MKRELVVVVALAAVGVLLISTGAFVDTPTDGIELTPSDGPNSVYAVADDDGTLKIDLSEQNQRLAENATGVPADSITTVERIFTVHHNGTADPARVWIETETDDVEFVRGADSPVSIEGEQNNVLLAPGDERHVGIVVDATGDHDVEEIEAFTLHVAWIDDPDDGTEVPSAPTPIDGDDPTDDDDNDAGDDGSESDEKAEHDDSEPGDGTTDDPESGDGTTDDPESGGNDGAGADDTDEAEQRNDRTAEPDEHAAGDERVERQGGTHSDRASAADDRTGNQSDDGTAAQPGAGDGWSQAGTSETPGGEEPRWSLLSSSFPLLLAVILLGCAIYVLIRYRVNTAGID